MTWKRGFVAAALALLAACRPSLSAAGARVAQVPSTPEGCELLGLVSGYVDYTGDGGRSDAKVKALNAAGALGANTVVWTTVDSAAFDSRVEGMAYRCPVRE